MARLHLDAPQVLIDRPVHMRLSGLDANEPVTLRASLQDDQLWPSALFSERATRRRAPARGRASCGRCRERACGT